MSEQNKLNKAMIGLKNMPSLNEKDGKDLEMNIDVESAKEIKQTNVEHGERNIIPAKKVKSSTAKEVRYNAIGILNDAEPVKP